MEKEGIRKVDRSQIQKGVECHSESEPNAEPLILQMMRSVLSLSQGDL